MTQARAVISKLTDIGSEIVSGVETIANGVNRVLSDGDGIGYVSEFALAILGAIPTPPKDIPYDKLSRGMQIATKTGEALRYITGAITGFTVVADISAWFVKNGKGLYPHQRSWAYVGKKVFWNTAHYIDFISWCKNIGLITSQSAAFARLAIVGSASRICANLTEIFISFRAINRSYAKEAMYDLSKKRWEKIANDTQAGTMTRADWAAFCQAKINGTGVGRLSTTVGPDAANIKGWAVKLAERIKEIKEKNPKITDDKDLKIKNDSVVKHCEQRVAYWTNLTDQVNSVNRDPKDEFKRYLRDLSRERVDRTLVGVQNQKDSRVREWLNIALSSIVIIGLAVTISVQATGSHSFFGLTGAAIPILVIALPVATTGTDLVNFIVCLFLKKKPLTDHRLKERPVLTHERTDLNRTGNVDATKARLEDLRTMREQMGRGTGTNTLITAQA